MQWNPCKVNWTLICDDEHFWDKYSVTSISIRMLSIRMAIWIISFCLKGQTDEKLYFDGWIYSLMGYSLRLQNFAINILTFLKKISQPVICKSL